MDENTKPVIGLKHEALIRAALDGKKIQFRESDTNLKWSTFDNSRLAVAHMAAEYPSYEYRLEPKPDKVQFYVYNKDGKAFGPYRGKQVIRPDNCGQVKHILDGETGKLKSVEIVK